MKNKFKEWGVWYVLLILILVVFAILEPKRTSLFVKEGVIWLSYMALITLTPVTKFKVWAGYLVALILSITVILMDK